METIFVQVRALSFVHTRLELIGNSCFVELSHYGASSPPDVETSVVSVGLCRLRWKKLNPECCLYCLSGLEQLDCGCSSTAKATLRDGWLSLTSDEMLEISTTEEVRRASSLGSGLGILEEGWASVRLFLVTRERLDIDWAWLREMVKFTAESCAIDDSVEATESLWRRLEYRCWCDILNPATYFQNCGRFWIIIIFRLVWAHMIPFSHPWIQKLRIDGKGWFCQHLAHREVALL